MRPQGGGLRRYDDDVIVGDVRRVVVVVVPVVFVPVVVVPMVRVSGVLVPPGRMGVGRLSGMMQHHADAARQPERGAMGTP